MHTTFNVNSLSTAYHKVWPTWKVKKEKKDSARCKQHAKLGTVKVWFHIMLTISNIEIEKTLLCKIRTTCNCKNSSNMLLLRPLTSNTITVKVALFRSKPHLEIRKVWAIAMLSKVRYYVQEYELKNIYLSKFESHVRYGCQIWYQSNSEFIKDTVQNLQKKVLQIMLFSELQESYSPLFE